MINNIKNAYTHCDEMGCHEIHTSTFYIKDVDKAKCETITNPISATCCIETVDTRNIDFLSIDKCLIDTNAIKKCDCVIVKDNVIWFIELKEVSFSGKTKKDIQKRQNGRKKAVKQLASTINDFKLKGLDLSSSLVAGLICFPPYINEANPITIPSTSSQARLLEFVNLCGYTELYEGNHVVL